MTVATLTHPTYNKMWSRWFKYRKCFEGGRDFIEEYLERFSKRETYDEFNRRKTVTYAPTHAKGALVDIKNSIFERMRDIIRVGGPDSYQNAIAGLDKGVDLEGNSMDGYIGRIILKELLVMGKVGVYVDKFPQDAGSSVADTHSNRPYLYHYPAEDIRSWRKDKLNNLVVLLLQDHIHRIDDRTQLVTGFEKRYRLLTRHFLEAENRYVVSVEFFNSKGVKDKDAPESMLLDIPEIPFVAFGLSESLLTDVADYQIALLNLESSDMSYVLKSNFPLYVEQFDAAADFSSGLFSRPTRGPNLPVESNSLGSLHGDSSIHGAAVGHGAAPPDGRAESAQISGDNTIELGSSSGRRYPKGMNEPNFINPSPDPIRVSMEKQEKIKNDIRRLVNLKANNVISQSSVEARSEDAGLLSGLAAIGMELQWGEREIARLWSIYEGHTNEDQRIQYPMSYSLKTEEERQEEADRLGKLGPTIPSEMFKKTIAKRQAQIIVGHLVPNNTLKTILDEIDAATVTTTDPEVISRDYENGFVTANTASQARGYPEGEAAKAQIEHGERLARIAAAQSSVPTDIVDRAAARGVPDADGNPDKSAAEEKTASRDNTLKGEIKDRTRGEGK